jgi:hypothetical protein
MRYASMKRFGLILGVAAGLICGAGVSASAAVLTYRYDPNTSFSLSNDSDGFLTGDFTINTASGAFSATADAAITSGPAAGVYAPLDINADGLHYESEAGFVNVSFTANLDNRPASPALEEVDWSPPPSSDGFANSLTVAGGATLIQSEPPIPEPSTWAMMLLGFGGLGFLGYRQTRKRQAWPLTLG